MKTRAISSNSNNRNGRKQAMQTSEQVDQIGAALAKSQAAFPTIPRSKRVKVKMKSGGEYTFDYAPLEEIKAKTQSILADNELSTLQTEDDGWLVTRLLHSSGQWIENRVRIIFQNGNAQEYGSAVTYARRYGYTTLLDLATDEDDDGNIVSGNQYDVKKQREPQKPKATAQDKAKAKELMEGCQTLDELKETWEGLPPHVREACASEKDAVKDKLMGDKQ